MTLGGSATPPPITLTSAGAGSDVVNWTPPQNSPELGIEFYRVVGGGGNAIDVDTTTGYGTSMSTGTATLVLPPGTSDVFAVAVGGFGTWGAESAYSNQVAIQNPIAIPADPAFINAVVDPNDNTKVDVSWQNTPTDQSAHILQRSLNGGPFEPIATLSPNTTSYVDSILSDNPEDVSVRYSVVATNSAGSSDPQSPVVSAATTAKASEAPDTATFVYGETPKKSAGVVTAGSYDQFPGTQGDGWADGWTPNAHGAKFASANVASSSPLVAHGKSYGPYLSASVASSTATGTGIVARDYSATSAAADHVAGIAASSPQDITFLFRFDNLTGGAAGSTDQATLFGGGSAQNRMLSTDTWEATASLTGSGNWVFSPNTAQPWNSGVPLIKGHVYSLTIDTDPSANTYTATITDWSAATAVTHSSGLLYYRYKNGSGSDYLDAGMSLGNGKTGSFSLDTVTVTAGTITTPLPVIVTNLPAAESVDSGTTATLTTAARGYQSVQWYMNTGSGFTKINGATSPTLTLPNVSASQTGTQYKAIYTDSAGGSIATNVTTLTVVSPVAGTTYFEPGDSLQVDLGKAQGHILQFPAGTFTFELTSPLVPDPGPLTAPLVLDSGTTIEGTTSGGVSLTNLIFNVDYDPKNDPNSADASVFELAPSTSHANITSNVTIKGLNLTSNWGILDMEQGNPSIGFSGINIVDNQFSFGAANANYQGFDLDGIYDTIPTSGLEVKYNKFANSTYMYTDRSVYGDDSTNSNFDNNEFDTVEAGVALNDLGAGCTFSNNYGTHLHDKPLEAFGISAYGFVADHNVFYDWSKPEDNSFGISLDQTDNGVAGSEPVTIDDNFIEIEPTDGWGTNTDSNNFVGSGNTYEVGGYPLEFNDNVSIATQVQNAMVDVNTPNGEGDGNTFYGSNNNQPQSIEGETGGSWLGQTDSTALPLGKAPSPPTNTFAGPENYG